MALLRNGFRYVLRVPILSWRYFIYLQWCLCSIYPDWLDNEWWCFYCYLQQYSSSFMLFPFSIYSLFSLLVAFFFLGDTISRKLFYNVRLINPFFFLIFSAVGIIIGLSDITILVPLTALGVAFANGSLYPFYYFSNPSLLPFTFFPWPPIFPVTHKQTDWSIKKFLRDSIWFLCHFGYLLEILVVLLVQILSVLSVRLLRMFISPILIVELKFYTNKKIL